MGTNSAARWRIDSLIRTWSTWPAPFAAGLPVAMGAASVILTSVCFRHPGDLASRYSWAWVTFVAASARRS